MIKRNNIHHLLILCSLLPCSLFAISSLWSGSILLVSFPCYLCRMIEGEQQRLPYSHIAMQLFSPTNHRPYWIEAWGTQGVALYPEKEFFDSLRQKRANIAQAHRGQFKAPLTLVPHHQQWQAALWEQALLLVGKNYDPAFLWYNRDDKGNEKYYCSELVAKLLNQSLKQLQRNQLIGLATLRDLTLRPKPMNYQHFWDQWVKYFAPAPVPQGEPGLTPEDIALAPLYQQ